MLGLKLSRVRIDRDRKHTTSATVGAGAHMVASLFKAALRLMQPALAPVTATITRLTGTDRSTPSPLSPLDAPLPAGTSRDWLRQALNLLLSITQFAAAVLIFSSQFGDDLFRNPSSQEPPIVPAEYTFGIWSVIFLSSIAYGVYQALPRQRSNDLLRRIGFQTAFAFGCITLWSVATLFDPIRYTVPLFFGALWALISALYQSSHHPRQLTKTERLLVSVPLGVYAAWCTVGTIANTSTSLVGLGYTDLIVGAHAWAVIMLLVAGLISALMTSASRGNLAYAAGIIWALIGIVVANVTERPNAAVALTASVMVVLVGLTLIRTRITTSTQAEAIDA